MIIYMCWEINANRMRPIDKMWRRDKEIEKNSLTRIMRKIAIVACRVRSQNKSDNDGAEWRQRYDVIF